MRLLLDTHILLWVAATPDRLTQAAQNVLNDPDSTLVFSAVNLWEISIKRSLGRASFQVDPRILRHRALSHGYEELNIVSEHAIFLDTLPMLHRDPFDRLLIAQATFEGMTLLTADKTVAQYSGPIRLV